MNMRIDVYPVGWHRSIQQSWRRLKSPQRRDWLSPLRWYAKYLARQIGLRNWRAVKNSCNGHLAEPDPWPEGLTRCGSGWTKRRAVRDLERRMRRVAQ